MLKNYIKIAWRNIVKGRLYSVVNIIGLSAGIAFAMLVSGYVWSELQVNSNLKNADRQYILQSDWKDPNMGLSLTTLGPLAKLLKEKYPNLVANYYRWDGVTSTVSKGEKCFREGIQLCDSTMMNMYGFSLKQGNPETAFADPWSVVITAARAIKYFGKTDVVGQSLSIESFSGSRHDFIISGVMNKPSKNSATFLTSDNDNQFYISEKNIGYFGRNMSWSNQYIVGYVELQKGVSAKDLEKPMQQLLQQNTAAQVSENLRPFLVSLKDFYLSGGLIKRMLYVLSGIAFFILLMALINFVNMSVSRSASRIKEIGLRKVLGSVRKQLIWQFLIESVILVFFATLFAIVLYILTEKMFGNILGKEIPALTDFPVYFIAMPVILIITTGFIAGIYPAFILSSVKTVDSLKGKAGLVKENVMMRKSLVTFQFCIAIISFVCAMIVSEQVNFFFSKDQGFNKEYIVSAQVPRNWSLNGVKHMEMIRRQFTELPQVKNATLSFEIPAEGGTSGSAALYKAGSDPASSIPSQVLTTDEYYAAAYGIPMAAGVFFCEPGNYTDSFSLVINETQAKAFGWKEAKEAIGKKMKFKNGQQLFTIAGVTKDFNFGSLQQEVQPVTFMHVNSNPAFRFLTFKMNPGNTGRSIAALQKQWSILLPGTPFEYLFVDDTLKAIYASEIQLKKASFTATALSVVIVLLGILGLISLSVQKRTKEIGIRKVLGSSVMDIVTLFLKEFTGIIFIAAAIAFPVAWLLMQKWLTDYIYRISITVKPFIFSLLLLAFITAALVVAQTIKTALANPVKSLRTE